MKFKDVYKKDGEPLLSTFFYDRLSYGLLKIIKDWPLITPNQLTILSFVFAIISASLFYINNIILAAMFMVGFFVLDCIDGQFARINNKCSYFGEFLDHAYGTIFIYLIYFSIAYNLESKLLAFGLLFSVVLYNYVVGITPNNNIVKKTRDNVSKKIRFFKPSYIGFGFDIQSFIMFVGALSGLFDFSLYLVIFGCLIFSIVRLILVTSSAR